MQGLNLTNTAIRAKDTPFVQQRPVCVLNLGEAAINLEGSDTQAGTYVSLGAVPAGGVANIKLTPWVRAASGTLILLGSA